MSILKLEIINCKGSKEGQKNLARRKPETQPITRDYKLQGV